MHSAYQQHQPVLLRETIDVLQPRAGGVYVDGTFGAGGYSQAMLEAAECHVYGIDRDPMAISAGAGMERAYPGRLTLMQGTFGEMEDLLMGCGMDSVDGVALDLGVSSMQLDEAERGFSFAKDGPLDMRMAQSGLSAADIVNAAPQQLLRRIFFVFGEERKAGAAASAIVRRRSEHPFHRTVDLADVIERAVGGRRHDRIHPATRCFQALRIAVNRELEQLYQGLAAAERLLSPGGRLAVVSFHSLEDRIVKRFFADRSGKTARPVRHMPEPQPGPDASFSDLLKGGVTASDDEVRGNPRARSARLRAGERTAAPAIALELPDFGVPLANLEVRSC